MIGLFQIFEEPPTLALQYHFYRTKPSLGVFIITIIFFAWVDSKFTMRQTLAVQAFTNEGPETKVLVSILPLTDD